MPSTSCARSGACGPFISSAVEHRVALALAQRFHSLAAKRSDPNDRLIGERMIGVVAALPGRPAQCAAPYRARARARCPLLRQKSQIIRFQIDQRVGGAGLPCADPVAAGISGSGDARRRKQRRRTLGRPITQSHCATLSPMAACPIALLSAIWPRRNIMWKCCSTIRQRHALALWHALGRSYQGVLVIKRGDLGTGLRLLRAGFDELGEAGSSVSRFFTFLMAEALGRAGQIADGLAAIEEAIARLRAHRRTLVIAELLRVKGELLLLQGAPGAAAAAEGHFRQALDWARRQGALSWELRAATSLARLLRDQARTARGARLLAPVYDRFTEGFDTADLKAAKALLEDLS